MVTLFSFWESDVAFVYLEPAKSDLYEDDTTYISLTQFSLNLQKLKYGPVGLLQF